ncbi:MAG: HmuY family protein, partial [Bacteroidales bacterium]|nr:HmuY family protein [Bacteroidales bacterium]
EDTAWSYREVYLLDRGLDERNREMGNKKVQFDIQGNDYVVRHANQDHSGDTTVVIGRDDNLDCIYYSFEKGVVDLAPLQDSWSLLFSRYTTMLQTDLGEDYPYLVTGVLLNPNGVAAALDTIHEFSEIEISDTLDLELTSRADVIGYEWKYYNFDAGLYTIVPEFNYVIRDRDGFYYKLRFIDFYNDTGEKGFPLFEYIRL